MDTRIDSFKSHLQKLTPLIIKQSLINIIAVLSPFLVVLVAISYQGYSLFQMMPSASDEILYYAQIKGMLENGIPLGYFGYNGGTAPFLTFGAHGFVVMIPYFLFASVFGLHYNTIFFCNVFLMSLAILIYILLLKPSWKQLVFLLITCLSVWSFNAQTSMMEAGFYAYMIIYAAIILRIAKKDETSLKIAGFIFIVFLSLTKATFSIVIFPLLIMTIKYKSLIVRIIISLSITLIFMYLSYMVYRLFSSPFFYHTYSAVSVSDLRNDFFGTILYLISNSLNGFNAMMILAMDLKSLWYVLSTIFVYFVLLYFCCYSVMEIINYIKTKTFLYSSNDIPLLFSSTVVMIGCIVVFNGVMVLPSLRNDLIALVFMLAVLSGLAVRNKAGFICVFAVFYLYFFTLSDHVPERSFATSEVKTQLETIENFLGDNIIISGEKSRWENTVAGHLYVNSIYILTAPPGAGWNMYLPDVMPVNEGYLVVPYNYEQLDFYTSSGFEIIAENDEVVILRNLKYS